MKNVIVFLALILSACSQQEEEILPDLSSGLVKLDASLSPIFNTWKLVSFEDNKIIKYEVSLEVKPEKNEKGLFSINGKSPINFYYAFFSADFAKSTIKIEGVSGTKIGATSLADATFEKEYWERLAAVEKFEISANNNKLTLHLPEKTNKKLIFQKN